jgi:hypothetical protein
MRGSHPSACKDRGFPDQRCPIETPGARGSGCVRPDFGDSPCTSAATPKPLSRTLVPTSRRTSRPSHLGGDAHAGSARRRCARSGPRIQARVEARLAPHQGQIWVFSTLGCARGGAKNLALSASGEGGARCGPSTINDRPFPPSEAVHDPRPVGALQGGQTDRSGGSASSLTVPPRTASVGWDSMSGGAWTITARCSSSTGPRSRSSSDPARTAGSSAPSSTRRSLRRASIWLPRAIDGRTLDAPRPSGLDGGLDGVCAETSGAKSAASARSRRSPASSAGYAAGGAGQRWALVGKRYRRAILAAARPGQQPRARVAGGPCASARGPDLPCAGSRLPCPRFRTRDSGLGPKCPAPRSSPRPPAPEASVCCSTALLLASLARLLSPRLQERSDP